MVMYMQTDRNEPFKRKFSPAAKQVRITHLINNFILQPWEEKAELIFPPQTRCKITIGILSNFQLENQMCLLRKLIFKPGPFRSSAGASSCLT